MGGDPRSTALAAALTTLALTASLLHAGGAGAGAPNEFVVDLPPVYDTVVLEPSDPRAPALAAERPGAAAGLYEGTLAATGARLALVWTETVALGVLAMPAGAWTWVTVEDARIVAWSPPEDADHLDAEGIDTEMHAPDDGHGDEAAAPALGAASTVDGTLQLLIDTDAEYVALHGEAWPEDQLRVLHLIEAIFNAHFDIDFEIVEQHAWDAAGQPVTGEHICGGNEDILRQFRDHWEATDPTLSSVRELAHLFSGKDLRLNTIGCAYISELETPWAYGVSRFPDPVPFRQDTALHRDVALVAHEMGHNFYGLHGDALPTPNQLGDVLGCRGSTLMYPVLCANSPVFSPMNADRMDDYQATRI